MLSNTQNSVTGKHGKDLKISKTVMADRWVLVQRKSIHISNVWNVGQFDIGQLGCGTSLVQYFGNLKFFGQVGRKSCVMGPYECLYRCL